MNLHSIKLLEYGEILKAVHDFALCPPRAADEYRELVERGNFSQTEPEINELVTNTKWLIQIINAAHDFPYKKWTGCPDIWESLRPAGHILELSELTELFVDIQALEEFIHFLQRSVQNQEILLPDTQLIKEINSIGKFIFLSKELGRFIDGNGGLLEDSIPEIKSAKHKILCMKIVLRSAASSLIKEYQDHLSGDFATQRDGRTVIPLKAQFRGSINGIVQSSSSSGETIYVEPFILIEKNNAVNQAEAEYLQAIHRILRQLSERARSELSVYNELYRIAGLFDTVWARARYARNIDGNFVKTASNINIISMCHPLLGKKAIPISLSMEDKASMLVLSGPNTGGKTVSLKTIGLAVLLKQSGIPIRTSNETCLPWFCDVLVDIGDEQSIEANLSTFSGHLTRIKECLELADKNTLVILDELGSGTDPDEGAALAVAIGEAFLDKSCITLASSHYGSLKALAHTDIRALNASMAYSEKEGRPTYQILVGSPGASHAIDTAYRIGLPPSIIARSRSLTSTEANPLVNLLRQLGNELENLNNDRKNLEIELQALVEERRSISEKSRALEQEKKEIHKSGIAELSAFMAQTRSKAEALLRELDERRKASGTADIDDKNKIDRDLLKDLSTSVNEKVSEQNEGIVLNEQTILAAGQRVRITGTRDKGTIIRAGKKGYFEVEIQGKRFHLAAAKLEAILENNAPKKSSITYELANREKAQFSLDIRGMRLSDVNDSMQRQLDAAVLQNLGYFSIVHGKGEGVLQKAVHEILAAYPQVLRFEFARPEDGGSGKTNVFMR